MATNFVLNTDRDGDGPAVEVRNEYGGVGYCATVGRTVHGDGDTYIYEIYYVGRDGQNDQTSRLPDSILRTHDTKQSALSAALEALRWIVARDLEVMQSYFDCLPDSVTLL